MFGTNYCVNRVDGLLSNFEAVQKLAVFIIFIMSILKSEKHCDK